MISNELFPSSISSWFSDFIHSVVRFQFFDDFFIKKSNFHKKIIFYIQAFIFTQPYISNSMFNHQFTRGLITNGNHFLNVLVWVSVCVWGYVRAYVFCRHCGFPKVSFRPHIGQNIYKINAKSTGPFAAHWVEYS